MDLVIEKGVDLVVLQVAAAAGEGRKSQEDVQIAAGEVDAGEARTVDGDAAEEARIVDGDAAEEVGEQGNTARVSQLPPAQCAEEDEQRDAHASTSSSSTTTTKDPFSGAKKYGGSYCAAVGCHNSQCRDGPRGVKFHSFPKNPDRRTQWILKVKRQTDGKPWKPSSSKQRKIECAHAIRCYISLSVFRSQTLFRAFPPWEV